ncbi:MAG: hypothetical protein JWN69_1761, partial [Alphaproteobacteria bacterium]|nr:hypothetical protein [Alphaproteobacteria bacterium]
MGVAMGFEKATARDLHQEVEDLVARHAELID